MTKHRRYLNDWRFSKEEEMPEGRQSLVIFYENDEIWYGRRYAQVFFRTDARGRIDKDSKIGIERIRGWMVCKQPPIKRIPTDLVSARAIYFKRLHNKELERLVEIRKQWEEKRAAESGTTS